MYDIEKNRTVLWLVMGAVEVEEASRWKTGDRIGGMVAIQSFIELKG